MTLITALSAFKDNYIWLFTDTSHARAWVVDPGDAQPVIQYLNQNKLILAGILLTHHHADHSGGIAQLIEHWPDSVVYGSMQSKISLITHRVREGDVIQCGDSMGFSVFEIPGHTLDHIAFYNDEILFCGDTLFSAGCGRVFEGTYAQMYDSLKKLLGLSDDIQIYCGPEYTLQNLKFAQLVEPENSFVRNKVHILQKIREENKPSLPSTLKEEKNINPFLRYHVTSVIQSCQKYINEVLNDPVDVFKCLREWKNQFG